MAGTENQGLPDGNLHGLVQILIEPHHQALLAHTLAATGDNRTGAARALTGFHQVGAIAGSESEHVTAGSDERREPLNLAWRNLSYEGVHALAVIPEDEARPSTRLERSEIEASFAWTRKGSSRGSLKLVEGQRLTRAELVGESDALGRAELTEASAHYP